jgi:hypothetical protein
LLHLENAYEYYVEERTEENFEDYFVDVTVIQNIFIQSL